jgi:hypothetical protein
MFKSIRKESGAEAFFNNFGTGIGMGIGNYEFGIMNLEL